jgi:hypothetical protein
MSTYVDALPNGKGNPLLKGLLDLADSKGGLTVADVEKYITDATKVADNLHRIGADGIARGDDALIAFFPDILKAGQKIGDPPVEPGQPDTREIAKTDLYAVLDGGKGNDWVITILGEGALTLGGEGRDWIFNTSEGGNVFGDTIDGLDSNRDKIKTDDPKHGDNIWWWPNTTLWDAGKKDVLKFFGWTLVGGSEGIPLVVGGLTGAFSVAPDVGDLAAYAARKAMNPTHPLAGRYFIDPLALWMSYGFFEEKNGKYSLYVANAFTGLADYVAQTDFSKTPDDISLAGGMRIVNWEVTASEWGLPLAGAEAGSLGMKFKMANPALALLSMLPPIGGMDPKTFVFLDKAFYFADAVYRFGKGMLWSAEGELDPLILDLDGDGIETLDRGSSGLRFDHNVDLFSETSGWLSGDDGFLVLDENKNGLIDNGTEMFGGNGVSGLGELATHDSNGDGKITVADVIWSELRVWRDLDEDAVTDDGELFTLDAVGISGINLQATANDNKALALTRAA